MLCAGCGMLQHVDTLFDAAVQHKETCMETERLGSMVTHI